MQFRLLALVVALVFSALTMPVMVSGIECTDDQLDALSKTNDDAVQAACPSLYDDGRGALDPTTVDSLTIETLTKLAPCKDTACLDQLNKLVENAPDCSVAGLNVKGTYQASAKLCTAFTTGNVTVQQAISIYGDVIKNVSNAFDSLLGGNGTANHGNRGTEGPGTGVRPTGSSSVPSTTPASGATTMTTTSTLFLMLATVVMCILSQ